LISFSQQVSIFFNNFIHLSLPKCGACAIAKSKSQKRIIPVQGKNDIICNHLVSLKKITNLIEIQSCDKCYYQAKVSFANFPTYQNYKINQSLNFLFSLKSSLLRKMKKFLHIQFFQTCIIFLKDKRQKDVEMADIEPSIQFESLSDRINIFAIKQILANSGH